MSRLEVTEAVAWEATGASVDIAVNSFDFFERAARSASILSSAASAFDDNVWFAVYLRDVEVRGEWSTLRDEIRVFPLPLKRKSSSVMERKLIELIPLWTERGEGLLDSVDGESPAPANEPHLLPGDDTEVRPSSPYL